MPIDRSTLSRPVSRRAVLGVGLGLVALPLLQACGPPATPTTAPKPAEKPAAAAPTPAPKPTEAAKPAEKPAEKPTAAAATKPAGTPAAAATGTPAAATGTPGAAATGTPAAATKPQLQKVGGTVNVLATWGGDEQQNFLAMVKPFEEQTGAKVQYEGTRDLNAVLTTRVAGGNPPDVAGLPGPGQMAQFARQGKLIDLSGVLDASQTRQWYSEDWTKLAQVEGKQVGIFIKAALKGLIWYNTKAFQQAGHQVPKSWDDLTALSQKIAGTGTTPWSIGLESGAASGWPGTDWIEDIVLRQAGTEVYDGWAQGKVKWSSDGIKKAWQTWGQIVNDPKMTFGGKPAVLSTSFQDAANPLFQNPPKAFLHHQANFMSTFITKSYSSLKPGQDFDVFPFPDIDQKNAGAVESAGDLFGMFKDTPPARELMKWLVTPDAQAIWVQKGGALSPNKAVPESTYPDPIAKRAGEALTTAKIVRFDASDLMPEAMNNAFWKGILDFVNSPNNLDQILASLDKTQADAYKM